MRRIKKITTLQQAIKLLNTITYNFFYTDYMMHKQGVVYEDTQSNLRKIKARMRTYFKKVKKFLEKSEKEKLVEILREKHENYLKEQEKRTEYLTKHQIMRVYNPEEMTEIDVCVKEMRIWRKIKEILEERKLEKKEWKSFVEMEVYLMEMARKHCRREFEEYGYVPRGYKKYKELRK